MATLLPLGRELSELAEARASVSPPAAVARVVSGEIDHDTALELGREHDLIFRRMIAAQEELDWAVYRLYEPAVVAPFIGETMEPAERQYLTMPSASSGLLALVEDRMYKRGWQDLDAESRSVEYVRAFENAKWPHVLSAIENLMGSGTEAIPLRRLVGSQEARELAGKLRFGDLVTDTRCAEEVQLASVPFLAAYRHTDPGLEKRSAWERVWELQRAEDRGESVPPFAPPPKYDQKDYRDVTYWRLRGKLDVPKERFISYPGCESDEDKEPVYGWAGWNHLQQALALAALYVDRKTKESWERDRLTPMLAGLLELLPWVKQWHNELDADSGLRMGDYFETFVDAECHALGLTREDLRAWRPPEKGKTKKVKAGGVEIGEAGAPPKKRGRKKATGDSAAT